MSHLRCTPVIGRMLVCKPIQLCRMCLVCLNVKIRPRSTRSKCPNASHRCNFKYQIHNFEHTKGLGSPKNRLKMNNKNASKMITVKFITTHTWGILMIHCKIFNGSRIDNAVTGCKRVCLHSRHPLCHQRNAVIRSLDSLLYLNNIVI